MGATSEVGNDLTPESFQAAVREWLTPGPYYSFVERVRLVGFDAIRDVAYPRYSWKHHCSYWDEAGDRYDIWLHWDGRARIEHDGEVILRMWAPAADIFRGIEDRRQARG